MKKEKIILPIWLWFKLMAGLKKRSNGCRESGGFLLAKSGEKRIIKVVFYDQFDKTVADSGIIQFKGAISFYEFLAKTGMNVIADIHTHPTKNTSQSYSDQTHPMIRIKDHIAIIAPNYVVNPLIFPKHCSLYKYLGNFQWEKYNKADLPFQLTLI